MKVSLPFTFKILLPYLGLLVLFLIIFFGTDMDEGMKVRAISAVGVIATVVFTLIHIFWLKRPLNRIRQLVDQLTQGKLPFFSASQAPDEIGDLERKLEKHVSHLQSLTSFAGEIASGDFTGSFEKRSDKDEIGEAMLSLKESLERSVKETEAGRREEEHRTWTAYGLAKFSKLFNEVEDDLHELSHELMKELVSYTEADVGALFISSDEESDRPQLELTGSYAFDRQKYLDRSFDFGEGLVGRAALEKESIYLTDLPPETLKIRSGLGEDHPTSILLVPLVLDDRVLGVIELASFGHFSDYQVDFIKQLADALATTLVKIKANLQTKRQVEAHREISKREEELLREIERLKNS